MAKNGFTLLEVMVAIVLVATAISALGLALRTGADSTRRAAIKAKGEALFTVALSQISDPITSDSGEFEAGAGSWEYNVEPYMEDDELYLAKLTVLWEEGGRRQSDNYSFLTCPEGLYPP
jgi:prepilin-type N-terminal cleavage/methylation domain-containing protein